MKERAIKRTKLYTALLASGIAYTLYLKLGFFPIPCIFFLITGLKCPGCGVTRMISHLAAGSFTAAFADNPFLFVCAPVIIYLVIHSEYVYIKTGSRKISKPDAVLSRTLVAAGILFAILRNIKL